MRYLTREDDATAFLGQAWLCVDRQEVTDRRETWATGLIVAGEWFDAGTIQAPATDQPLPSREMLSGALSFMAACLESGPDGENGDLYPSIVHGLVDPEDVTLAALELDG